MEAENPEPDKLQPRCRRHFTSAGLDAPVGSSSLSTSNVLTSIAVSIRDTASEVPIGGEVAGFSLDRPGCFAAICSVLLIRARIDNCDTEIVTAAFPYAKARSLRNSSNSSPVKGERRVTPHNLWLST
jgi:hypothetical protein